MYSDVNIMICITYLHAGNSSLEAHGWRTRIVNSYDDFYFRIYNDKENSLRIMNANTMNSMNS